MILVVADTSPLNYLVLIGETEILPALFDRVLIPPEVLMELEAPGAPAEVAQWIQLRPHWLEVRRPDATSGEPDLLMLDPGERAAILLAQQEGTLLLIDDAAGRKEAQRCGVPSTGTLGVLRAAAIRNLIELPLALEHLSRTNFRISRSLLIALIAEDEERRQKE